MISLAWGVFPADDGVENLLVLCALEDLVSLHARGGCRRIGGSCLVFLFEHLLYTRTKVRIW